VQAFFLYFVALGAGVSVATQQVLNGNLRTALGSPAWAGLFSYAGGLLTMIVAVIVLGEHVPSLRVMANVPRWAWSGGVFGGAFILLAILLLPALGAATLFALVIAGQVLAAVTLDHFGAFGLTPHPISAARLASTRAGPRIVCRVRSGVGFDDAADHLRRIWGVSIVLDTRFPMPLASYLRGWVNAHATTGTAQALLNFEQTIGH
jgi:transporter family-2 protein